ncbi:MAG TPA: CvpA family protein [Verrucomicrobiae bacterium]|nr:CvpA family protein [Verrucomicrobiae bacterium]
MNLDHSPVNWFDFLVVIMILLGINKGRKHGMSEEMMISMQWLAIIFAGAFLYKPLGEALSQSSPMSRLFCYIAMYLTLAAAIKVAFVLFKKAIGGKLIGSNVFGAAEYYLGMVAGVVRFLCILVFGMAVLNAPYYSSQALAATKAYELDVYGSQFFPGVSSVQQQVFKESLVGSQFKQHVGFLLISPTAPEKKDVKRRKEDLP